jgi:hypothetical protein
VSTVINIVLINFKMDQGIIPPTQTFVNADEGPHHNMTVKRYTLLERGSTPYLRVI